MRLYVGNLDRTITEEMLRELFEQFGTVSSVQIFVDKFTGNSKGFAFVDMPQEVDANHAMRELNEKELEGKVMRICQMCPN